jgi:sec-independent protein translocase protein TatA
MFQNIGFTEILLIAIVGLLLFGPQKLPELGRALGRTIHEFKKGTRELLSNTPLAPPTAEAPATPAAPLSAAAPDMAPAAEQAGESTATPTPQNNARRLPD